MNNQKSLCCYADIKPTFGDGPEACSQCGRIIGAELPAKTTEELILSLKAEILELEDCVNPEWLEIELTQLAKAVENNVHTQSALEAERDKGIKWMQEGTNKNRKGFTDGYNQALTDIADYHRSKVIE